MARTSISNRYQWFGNPLDNEPRIGTLICQSLMDIPSKLKIFQYNTFYIVSVYHLILCTTFNGILHILFCLLLRVKLWSTTTSCMPIQNVVKTWTWSWRSWSTTWSRTCPARQLTPWAFHAQSSAMIPWLKNLRNLKELKWCTNVWLIIHDGFSEVTSTCLWSVKVKINYYIKNSASLSGWRKSAQFDSCDV